MHVASLAGRIATGTVGGASREVCIRRHEKQLPQSCVHYPALASTPSGANVSSAVRFRHCRWSCFGQIWKEQIGGMQPLVALRTETMSRSAGCCECTQAGSRSAAGGKDPSEQVFWGAHELDALHAALQTQVHILFDHAIKISL